MEEEYWRRKPTPVFLRGESHEQGSLAGYSQSKGVAKTWTKGLLFCSSASMDGWRREKRAWVKPSVYKF